MPKVNNQHFYQRRNKLLNRNSSNRNDSGKLTKKHPLLSGGIGRSGKLKRLLKRRAMYTAKQRPI
jgi:hypothetical protein